MKIKQEHYDFLKTEIGKIPRENIEAHKSLLSFDSRIKDFDKRLRWDMLYASVSPSWICDNLYPYMNDTHIDTALRAIVKELNV